jgi:hypothetical protein
VKTEGDEDGDPPADDAPAPMALGPDDLWPEDKLVSVYTLADSGSDDTYAFYYRPCPNCPRKTVHGKTVPKVQCAACQAKEAQTLTVKRKPPARYQSDEFALGMHDEATFFTHEALTMFWGEILDAAMRMKSVGSGRMAADAECDDFESGQIQILDADHAKFREYVRLRGKVPDGAMYQVPGSTPPHYEQESYLDRHLDPYGPMNEDMEQIEWRHYQSRVDEQFMAAAVSIQTDHTVAEIRHMAGPEKDKLQTLCARVGVSITKAKLLKGGGVKQVAKNLGELREGLIAVIFPHKGKDPPRTIFKFGVFRAHLNIGKGKQGGWTAVLFWRSIERLIDIWEFMRPTKTLVMVYDNSSAHRCYRDTALNVNNQNLGPGGYHTVNGRKKLWADMHDTTWDGKDGDGHVMKGPDGKDVAWVARPAAQQKQARFS